MNVLRTLNQVDEALVDRTLATTGESRLSAFLQKMYGRLGNVCTALVFPGLLLLAWSLAVRYEFVSSLILPAPEQVGATLVELLRNGDIAMHLQISLGRVLQGFLVGSLAGLLLGIAMGLSATLEEYIAPLFKAISSVPLLGWLPLAILFVGIGEVLKLVIIAKACFVPLTLNTLDGIRNTPRAYLEVAKVLQFNQFTLLRKVVLPAALPAIFSGVSLALSNAWITLVAVELLASSEGIGFMMVWGRQLFQMDVVLSAMIVIGVVGFGVNQCAKALETYFLRWRRSAI